MSYPCAAPVQTWASERDNRGDTDMHSKWAVSLALVLATAAVFAQRGAIADASACLDESNNSSAAQPMTGKLF